MTQAVLMFQIHWEDFSRGFQGGLWESAPEVVFDMAGEKCTLQFTVREYTSDDELDYFGTPISKWLLEVEITDVKFVGTAKEYEAKSKWGLGNDFYKSDLAKEFAEYVLYSYKNHQSLAVMPVAILDGYDY